MQKPFLKWVGGKTQLLSHIEHHIPKNINNYHEIFLGGGSVLFFMLHLQKTNKITIKNIYAYDINKSLINLYHNIQNNPNEVFHILEKYVKEYKIINEFKGNKQPTTYKEALNSKESYYYWIRKLYNESEPNSLNNSALFLFLNKTCFRGLYREGPNGFNVPFGHYKTSNFPSQETLITISKLIKNVHFQCLDYKFSTEACLANDFVYLDPPYVPENTSSFVKYNLNGFPLKEHQKLFEIILNFKKRNINFLLSNSYTPLVIDTFKEYNIIKVNARRAINSKSPNSITKEVLIHNI